LGPWSARWPDVVSSGGIIALLKKFHQLALRAVYGRASRLYRNQEPLMFDRRGHAGKSKEGNTTRRQRPKHLQIDLWFSDIAKDLI
jgi:hypothetical protein